MFICPTKGKDAPRVFIFLVIISTCYISNISRISLLVRLVSSDSVKVITGHIRLRTRVHSWTHVRILICPVITFIGHKPFPSLFWRNSFFTFFQLCWTHCFKNRTKSASPTGSVKTPKSVKTSQKLGKTGLNQEFWKKNDLALGSIFKTVVEPLEKLIKLKTFSIDFFLFFYFLFGKRLNSRSRRKTKYNEQQTHQQQAEQ